MISSTAKSLDPSHQWRTILWFLIPIYLVANAYLLVLGEVTGVIFRFVYAVYLFLLLWLTHRVTEPLTPAGTATSHDRSRIGVQLAMLIVIILLTGLPADTIPLWSKMVAWFHSLGESVLPVAWFGGPGNAVANPVQYFVIPFLLLLSLGATPAAIGLGKGNKGWQVCLVWLALPIIIWVILLATGRLPAQTLARRILGNFFQNGFFEEFLFRGALFTRLRCLVPIPWALMLQALLFGLWHLQANTESMAGNFVAGLALCLVSQTLSGIVFGYVFQRTQNLVAPSVAHVAMNVLGQTFG